MWHPVQDAEGRMPAGGHFPEHGIPWMAAPLLGTRPMFAVDGLNACVAVASWVSDRFAVGVVFGSTGS